MTLKALIFDVDGTLAETEEAHRSAFNRTFAEAGHDWEWSPEHYRRLLETTGGKERIAAFLDEIGESLAAETIARLHARKNAIYAQLVAGGEVALRPGVVRLIDEARAAGVGLAIATTTSRANLAALLGRLFGLSALGIFAAVVAGEDVSAKKPDPEVYARTLALLGLAPGECLAIEDSRNGMLAARAAGLPVLVTPSRYTDHEVFDGAALLRPDLDSAPAITLADCERLVSESPATANAA
ncbi:HAD-IA family hydrolase [Novosphingobium sp. Gsoil 351]|uniref:HAD-IA family hydrolase n=1 Tax=Novosphingobium sp. Gsoil 351 TaxID=2675225 RepID=UPI0012B4834D|nr:HAD-IA family hydrolase [Novosphingobium sp. Gsoil 351]QGN54571.1 HAD-IA family hydrolase [Novosphingobium sp. Gsoil 351]